MLNFKETDAVYSLYPKKTNKEIISAKIKCFVLKHNTIFIYTGIILLGVLMTLLALALAKNMSMVESGQFYNHLQGVI